MQNLTLLSNKLYKALYTMFPMLVRVMGDKNKVKDSAVMDLKLVEVRR